MARRPYRYQVDRRKNRKRVASPTDGWRVSELCTLAATRPRTIRNYCDRGLLTRPAFRGRSTRYSREMLVRLLAIKLWRLDDTRVTIDWLRARLAEHTPEQLETWVLSRPVSPAVRAALDASRVPSPVNTAPSMPQGHAMSQVHGATSEAAPTRAVDNADVAASVENTVKRSDKAASSGAPRAFIHLQLELGVWLDRLVT
jgi:DNA-binding transcriptional MerR regulator